MYDVYLLHVYTHDPPADDCFYCHPELAPPAEPAPPWTTINQVTLDGQL